MDPLGRIVQILVNPTHLAYGPPGSPITLGKHSSPSVYIDLLTPLNSSLKKLSKNHLSYSDVETWNDNHFSNSRFKANKIIRNSFSTYLAKLDFIFLFRAFCDNSFVGHAKKEADMYSIQMTF